MSRLAMVLCLSALLTSCALSLPQEQAVSGPSAVIDLSGYDFEAQAPVHPVSWAWDDTLWSPLEGGRPAGLLPPSFTSGPETGGTLKSGLMRPYLPGNYGGLQAATAHVSFLVPNDRSLALLIGAFPGAQRVWVNSVMVLEHGVLSTDQAAYRADGFGDLVTVQPRDGRLDIVVQMVTDDPLVVHSEMGRRWWLGGTQPLRQVWEQETLSRGLQSVVLAVATILFLLLGFLRHSRSGLVPFGCFLLVCLAKLTFNVEVVRPLFYYFLPSSSPSLFLFLNHGLNLLPFPLLVWFFRRQFPQEFPRSLVVVFAIATVLAEMWELAPFIALANGAEGVYVTIRSLAWSSVLDLFTLVAVLSLFERLFVAWRRRRPLASSFFWGGLVLGLMTLIPVVVGQFAPVSYSYSLGWGLFVFLILVSIDLMRNDLKLAQLKVESLETRLEAALVLSRWLSPRWSTLLGRERLEDLRPGDGTTQRAIVVSLEGADVADWLAKAGTLASSRGALLFHSSATQAVWMVEPKAEVALSLALALRDLLLPDHPKLSIVLDRALIMARVVDAGDHWVSQAQGPRESLETLHRLARESSAHVVAGTGLADGLVAGQWRGHRIIDDVSGAFEVYEGEGGRTEGLRNSTLTEFQEAVARASHGDLQAAREKLLRVLKQDPLDQAARRLLLRWSQAETI